MTEPVCDVVFPDGRVRLNVPISESKKVQADYAAILADDKRSVQLPKFNNQSLEGLLIAVRMLCNADDKFLRVDPRDVLQPWVTDQMPKGIFSPLFPPM